jgi:hypothetical protein
LNDPEIIKNNLTRLLTHSSVSAPPNKQAPLPSNDLDDTSGHPGFDLDQTEKLGQSEALEFANPTRWDLLLHHNLLNLVAWLDREALRRTLDSTASSIALPAQKGEMDSPFAAFCTSAGWHVAAGTRRHETLQSACHVAM